MLKENKPQGIDKIFFAWLQHEDISQLEGRILTIIDASIAEPRQNKATKDLIRQAIWFNWANQLDRVEDGIPVGMP